MADLAKILDAVLPEGSEPISRDEFEERLIAVLYPRRVTGGTRHTYIDAALVHGTLQALGDFGLVRFSNAKGNGGATRVGSDLVYRTDVVIPDTANRFGLPARPANHGTREAIVDEHGDVHHFPIGAQADAEKARIQRVRKNEYIAKIRRDLAEEIATV